ncbi:MAG: tRNA (adenosine(37)-N6)-threonylcarbamoyltransferase complex ATPase subunit type 1 TsaE [Candidatus Omnitrophica bacterium]|nr:tRNA (adenosine(37)-N6)-threonylcarbamoyltransferase complex ATPase subunit type 1 TsaE [Candidatus Omnitrophota bacterium]MDD5238241.1 tRNA (adenosine(37)-N6)-threonylcarbamoyltransferase complex ATPase subunit type 1 TsaE [Candidatus Omnitrophota bacterium]
MEIISKSARDTLEIGRRISKRLRKGDIICLFGELGSGKTVLVKGIAKGLGIEKNNIVSPSFVLMRLYIQGRLPLYHFDLYRLKKTKDILALGLEEYIYGDGITVIEWADRLKNSLPKEFLKINLSFKADSQRRISFTGVGAHYKQLLGKINEPRTLFKVRDKEEGAG